MIDFVTAPLEFAFMQRALLAAVTAATALYWLDDESEGSADTYAFMDRRIADVMKVPRLRAAAGAVLRPDSLARAEALGMAAAAYLAQHRSFDFFAALDDLLITGPTRTNVNDFRAIFIEAGAPDTNLRR